MDLAELQNQSNLLSFLEQPNAARFMLKCFFFKSVSVLRGPSVFLFLLLLQYSVQLQHSSGRLNDILIKRMLPGLFQLADHFPQLLQSEIDYTEDHYRAYNMISARVGWFKLKRCCFTSTETVGLTS